MRLFSISLLTRISASWVAFSRSARASSAFAQPHASSRALLSVFSLRVARSAPQPGVHEEWYWTEQYQPGLRSHLYSLKLAAATCIHPCWHWPRQWNRPCSSPQQISGIVDGLGSSFTAKCLNVSGFISYICNVHVYEAKSYFLGSVSTFLDTAWELITVGIISSISMQRQQGAIVRI